MLYAIFMRSQRGSLDTLPISGDVKFENVWDLDDCFNQLRTSYVAADKMECTWLVFASNEPPDTVPSKAKIVRLMSRIVKMYNGRIISDSGWLTT